MILRPFEPPVLPADGFLPAWEIVERLQSRSYDRCWMITQPSHAALAGELAAKVSDSRFPTADDHVLRAIALHDAGWGIPDAQAIMQSRSVHEHPPQSFLGSAVSQFLDAWKNSIATAESVSFAGGYIVSRHFWRLARHRVSLEQGKPERAKLEAFLKTEEHRQEALSAQQSLSPSQLESLTDLLQFFDLLSLYICCGARQSVIFPECFGVKLRLTADDRAYRLDPPLWDGSAEFKVASLRYPATKSESSREIQVKIDPQ